MATRQACVSQVNLFDVPHTPGEVRHAVLPHWITVLALSISVAVLMARFFWLINRDAVNLLFADQWDLYNPLFRHEGAWGAFMYKHGPHRLGLGGLLTFVVAQLSGWNTRAEAFAIGAIIVAAMALALLLKKRLFGSLTLSDVCIPLIFLTLSQYETLTVAPNPGHSAVPLLLVMAYALAWTIGRRLWRYTAVLVINVGLIYTGFGLFMGAITLALFAIESVQRMLQRRWSAGAWAMAGFALAAISLASFFVGYVFSATAGCFTFPYERPWKYGWFASLMFARFLDFSYTQSALAASLIGGVALAFALVVFCSHAWQLVHGGLIQGNVHLSVAILLGFTLIFCANAAIGRVCLGLQFGQSSRYMTLLIPGLLGMYFHVLTLRRPRLRLAALTLIVALLLPVPLPVRADDWAESGGWQQGKQIWKQCYLNHHAIEQCSKEAGVDPYPAADPIRPKLAYLQEQRLNLFLDAH